MASLNFQRERKGFHLQSTLFLAINKRLTLKRSKTPAQLKIKTSTKLNEEFHNLYSIWGLCGKTSSTSSQMETLFLKMLSHSLLYFMYWLICLCRVLVAARRDLPCFTQDASLRCTDSLVVENRLSSRGVWAYLLHGLLDQSSLTKDQTHVPCIARGILNHWPSRNHYFMNEEQRLWHQGLAKGLPGRASCCSFHQKTFPYFSTSWTSQPLELDPKKIPSE